MDMLTTIIVALCIAGLTPLAAFATNSFVEKGRRERAKKRLEKDPLVRVGASIKRLHTTNYPEPIMVDCHISRFEVGYMEVTTNDRKETVSFSGREFEGLIVVFDMST